MNARFISRVLSSGLLLLAAAILGGCASGPGSSVPMNRSDQPQPWSRGYAPLYHEANTLETSTYAWVDHRGIVMYSPTRGQVRGRLLSEPYRADPRHANQRFAASLPDGRLLPPEMRLKDIEEDLAIVGRELARKSCNDGGRATDAPRQAAGAAVVGAAAGAFVSLPAAIAAATIGGVGGAGRAIDWSRLECQDLRDYRHYLQRQAFLAEEWEKGRAARERQEAMDMFRRR